MAISTINQAGLNAPLTLTSPVLTTPNLGTPSALVLTNATALPATALPAGSIKQVVQSVYNTYTTMASSTYTDTGLTASITPTSATSRILIQVTIAGVGKNSANSDNCVKLALVKNGSILSYMDDVFGYTGTTISLSAGSAFNYIESPATTSAITYKVQFANYVNGGTVWVNNYSAVAGRSNSTLTLWEIAG
jgi:hypothetical protein